MRKRWTGFIPPIPTFIKTAVKFDKLGYMDVLGKSLGVMDSTATSLCMDNNIPIHVFGLDDPENIVRAVRGENIGTIVKKEEMKP